MSRGGRHSSVFLCAVVVAYCGTLLASPPTEAKAKSEGLFERLENLEIRPQNHQEGQQGVQGAATTSRIFGEAKADHDFHYMVLPVQSRRIQQFEQPTVVRELRSALHDSTLVAKSVGQRKVAKSEKEERKGQREESREARASCQGQGGRGSGTFWKDEREYRQGRRVGSEHTVGDNDTNASSSSKDAGSSRVNTNQCCSQGEGKERRSWRSDEQSQSDEETASGEGHHRRGRFVEPQQSGAVSARPHAGAALDSQSADATAKSRESKRCVAHADWGTRPEVEDLARVHDQEAWRATESLSRKEESPYRKTCGDESKSEGIAKRNQGGGGLHENARGRRILGNFGGQPLRRSDRPDRTERRRRCGHELEVSKKEDRRAGGRSIFAAKGAKNREMRWNNVVQICLYEEGGEDRDLCFEVTNMQLANWDSKPWSYRPGRFAMRAGYELFQRGIGLHRPVQQRQQRDGGELCLCRPKNELYDIKRLCGGRAHRELPVQGLQQGLLQEWIGKSPVRQVVTYGLCNVAIGERHATIDTDKIQDDQAMLNEIERVVQELWHDRWRQNSTRIYVVEPQPHSGYREEGQLHLIVEHEGEATAMQNVPVLFEECCYDGKELWTMKHAAYLDHVVSWYGAAQQLGLPTEELCRQGNYLCVWLGSQLITDDDQYLVPQGCKFTMSYRTCGNGGREEEAPQVNKKMRTEYEQRDDGQEEQEDQRDGGDEEPEGEESEEPTTSEEEDDPSRAYMFHWVGDYAYERLDQGSPVHRRSMVAGVWGIDVEEVIGLHPLRARPPDLRPDHEALITRWRSDNEHRQWLTDVQVLLDIRLEGRDQGVKRRSVRWIRHQMTWHGILRWLRIDEYCRRTMGGQCQIWFNNVLWLENDPEIKNVKMGDYLRISLPPEATRDVLEQERRLKRIERIQREERFFAGEDTDTPSESEEDQEEDPGTDSAGSRRTEEEPEPHAELLAHITIAGRLSHQEYQPTCRPQDDGDPTALDFGEVWDLLAWMDAAITIPAWLPPEGVEWHSATTQWINELAWWNMEPPDEIWYYTDGSKTKEGSGAATMMYIKSGNSWYYGGYLSQPCPVRCAHFAEIVAIGMSIHWLNNILMYCAMTQDRLPNVVFAFDATSAGYKIFGRWGGDKYPEETNNLRSVWMMMTMRYRFTWQTRHQKAHEGDPGNEGANTLAQGAATGRFRTRSTSTWATYLITTNEMAVHWLWSLWKSEWQEFWKGRLLYLPAKPETQPDHSTLHRLLQQEAQEMDCDEEEVLQLNIATANVLSLLPAAKKWKEYGLTGKTRTEMIQAMCVEAKLHVIGLQATRIKGEKTFHTPDYWVFAGSATNKGHYGVQIWFARRMAIDKENGHCVFQLDHFKILHQGPRLLIVKVSAPFLKAIFVCGHAPHSAATDEEKTKWWEGLQEATPSKYQDWRHFLRIDANARLGDCISEGISDHQAEKQDLSGDLLQEYVAARQLWLPSTFEAVHEGDTGTWYHQQQDKWLRGDYIGIPCDLPLHHCRSRLCPEIEIALQKDDHRVTMVTMGWNCCVPKVKKKKARRNARDDGQWLQAMLHGEDAYNHATSLQEAMPQCDWRVDTHTHMSWIQRSLSEWVRSKQPPQRQIPRKKSMSDETWKLVCSYARNVNYESGYINMDGENDEVCYERFLASGVDVLKERVK